MVKDWKCYDLDNDSLAWRRKELWGHDSCLETCDELSCERGSRFILMFLHKTKLKPKGRNYRVIKSGSKKVKGTSLAVQWLGLHLPMQGPKKQNTKQKQYCNKFNKDFKNGPHQKKNLKKREKDLIIRAIHQWKSLPQNFVSF